MKQRDLIKKLEDAGFHLKKHGGNHDTYKRGSDTEQVPRHTEINEKLGQQKVKNSYRRKPIWNNIMLQG